MKLALQCDEIDVHLAIFREPFLSAILDGRKTVESRFGVHRCAPYESIKPGDIILLKHSGGPIVGLAIASAAQFFSLSPSVLLDLRKRFGRRLYALDDTFWDERAHKQYATLIDIDDPIEIPPVEIEKRDRRGWVCYSSGAEMRLDI